MAVYTGKMFESTNPYFGGTYELIIDEAYTILADDYNEVYYEVISDFYDDDVVMLKHNPRIKFYMTEE
ncbi:hypothetical protein CSP48_004030 [Salmonella enterica subsp. arizonae]|nr:hypothetical protein [Salmonella enterica subsp. arizonae]